MKSTLIVALTMLSSHALAKEFHCKLSEPPVKSDEFNYEITGDFNLTDSSNDHEYQYALVINYVYKVKKIKPVRDSVKDVANLTRINETTDPNVVQFFEAAHEQDDPFLSYLLLQVGSPRDVREIRQYISKSAEEGNGATFFQFERRDGEVVSFLVLGFIPALCN